jgi:hypothetical protein
MKKSIAIAMVLATSVGGSAFAAQNVANTSQKGSLLVFPKIDVSPGVTTLVSIQNDYFEDVSLKCYYMDFFKNKRDFKVMLTKDQPFWFNAKTGEGTTTVPSFPSGPADAIGQTWTPFGELNCWAVNQAGSDQIKWNHLAGTATVIDYGNLGGGAYEYNSWNFTARVEGPNGVVVGNGGELVLDGGENYDACPQYLIAGFTPFGAAADLEPGIFFGNFGNRLSISTCNQDLKQDMVPHFTKLKFDVWNEHEVKFTGAYQCIDSWYESFLTQLGANPEAFPGQGAEIFRVDTLGTLSARYRVEGIPSDVCPFATEPAGLLGVQASRLGFLNDPNDLNSAVLAGVTGTTLNTAGAHAGFVRWDTQPAEIPER